MINTIKTSADHEAAYARAIEETKGTTISDDSLKVLLMQEILKKQSRKDQNYTR